MEKQTLSETASTATGEVNLDVGAGFGTLGLERFPAGDHAPPLASRKLVDVLGKPLLTMWYLLELLGRVSVPGFPLETFPVLWTAYQRAQNVWLPTKHNQNSQRRSEASRA